VNTSKFIFLVVLIVISLCFVDTQIVESQDPGVIYITSDGSFYSSTNLTIPIQQDGNIYSLTDNIEFQYLVVQRSNIIIDGAGYSIAGQGQVGIDLSFVSNVTIKNVNILSALYGIYLYNASSNIISRNTITYTGYGIYLAGSSQNTVIDNQLTNNNVGIYIMSSSNNELRDNNMDNNNNLAVYGTESSHFDNDVDESNLVNGKKVYYLIGESNLFINPTTYPDMGFLALVNCQNITVRYMELTKNGQGIILADTTDSTITQNEIMDNYNGIFLFASSRNYIIGNNITNNYRGIQFSSISNGNTLSTNNITNNTDGIFLFNSLQNSIVANNITRNKNGMGLKESSYNMIRGNYFIDNERQVYDVNIDDSTVTPSINIWGVGYPVGGNYWSDYMGVDVKSGGNQNQTGGDGLGDTPYIIDDNNNDGFPLMPYGSPPAIYIISPENKTYSVNSVTLSFTVSESTNWIKYSLDGQANVTITEDTVLSELTYGVHSIRLYAQDTDEQIGTSETIYFTITEGSGPTQSEAFPLILIAAIMVVAAIVGVVLFYFLKIKKK
jgi:parallel beta-helix repeat protein